MLGRAQVGLAAAGRLRIRDPVVGSRLALGLGHTRSLARSAADTQRTLALTLSAWRGFYRWLGQDGLVALNPAEGVRAPVYAR